MARLITVDASVLIAYIDPTDQHHNTAVEELASVEPPLWVHPITMAEVLVNPTKSGAHTKILDQLTAIGVIVDPTPIDPVVLAALRANSGCKLPDCCVMATANSHRSGILTFDERLRNAYRR